MKKTLIFGLITFSSISLLSCEELDLGLTDTEIVAGLKEALNIGTDNSVTSASATDGYLKNEVIKIILPPEVQALQEEVETGSLTIAGVDIKYSTIMNAYVLVADNIDSDPFEELTIAMNRGAEQAAVKAKPIFIDAITGMSVADGLAILQGDSTAATAYFQNATQAALITAFQPDVKAALDQTAANDIYADLIGFLNYSYEVNLFITTYTVKVSDYISLSLPETLDGYATEKATNGLFHLVGEEEKKIRKDPFAWASDIIAKVFGSDEAKGE